MMSYKEIKKSFERLQRVTAVALCVVLAGSFYSCTKKSEVGGEVPFVACPCENESLKTIKGKALLFVDEPYVDGETMIYRSYENGDFVDSAFLRLQLDFLFPNTDNLPDMPAVVYICNFPEFAKQLETSGGIDVYYEGIIFPNCEEFGCRAFCYTIVLTKLKI